MIIWSEKQYEEFKRKAGLVEPTTEAKPDATPVAPTLAAAIPASPRQINVGSGLFNKFIMGLGLMAIGSILSNSCQPQPIAKSAVAVAAPVVKSHNSHIVKHRIKRKKACRCNCIKNKVVDKPTEAVKVEPSVKQIERVLTNDAV